VAVHELAELLAQARVTLLDEPRLARHAEAREVVDVQHPDPGAVHPREEQRVAQRLLGAEREVDGTQDRTQLRVGHAAQISTSASIARGGAPEV